MPEETVKQPETAQETPPTEAAAPEAPQAEAASPVSPDVVERLVEERLGDLKKELQALKRALKKDKEEPAPNPQEALLAELESLWELEIADLPKADRELLAKILPATLSPLDRLKIVRGLRAAGKLGGAPANVGTRAPAPAAAPKPEPESPEEVARRILSLRKTRAPGRVPPGWEGR